MNAVVIPVALYDVLLPLALAGAFIVFVFIFDLISALGLPKLYRAIRSRVRSPRVVYICHPFAGDIDGNKAAVLEIARKAVAAGVLPVAPHLYLPQLLDEATDRRRALELCERLIDGCDELRIHGNVRSPGMEAEIAHARRRGIAIVDAGASK